jgi:hypothetical protein
MLTLIAAKTAIAISNIGLSSNTKATDGRDTLA